MHTKLQRLKQEYNISMLKYWYAEILFWIIVNKNTLKYTKLKY